MHVSRLIYPFENAPAQPRHRPRPVLACALLALLTLLALAGSVMLGEHGMPAPYGGDLAAFGP